MILWLLFVIGFAQPPEHTHRPTHGVLGTSAVSDQRTGRSVEVRRSASQLYCRLWLVDGDEQRVLVDDGGNPDQPALSDDGRLLAYVSGASGISSVYVMVIANGRTFQLTNVDLRRTKGEMSPPEGFVPSPADGSLVVSKDSVSWTHPLTKQLSSVALPSLVKP